MVTYNGAHSIRFGDGQSERNTWTDWHLIPVTRPTMALPSPQLKFVDIPGRSGSIDLTNYLTDNLAYSDRSGSFEFIIDNELESHMWMALYEQIAAYLHGKSLWMVLTDNPEWSYHGRFSIESFKSESNYCRVTISYRVEPFKQRLDGSTTGII